MSLLLKIKSWNNFMLNTASTRYMHSQTWANDHLPITTTILRSHIKFRCHKHISETLSIAATIFGSRGMVVILKFDCIFVNEYFLFSGANFQNIICLVMCKFVRRKQFFWNLTVAWNKENMEKCIFGDRSVICISFLCMHYPHWGVFLKS